MANDSMERAASASGPRPPRARSIVHGAAPVAAACFAWFTHAVAHACPDCNIGRVARAQFWSDGFAQNLVFSAAPFVVIVGASLLAERMDRPPKTRSEGASHGQ